MFRMEGVSFETAARVRCPGKGSLDACSSDFDGDDSVRGLLSVRWWVGLHSDAFRFHDSVVRSSPCQSGRNSSFVRLAFLHAVQRARERSCK